MFRHGSRATAEVVFSSYMNLKVDNLVGSGFTRESLFASGLPRQPYKSSQMGSRLAARPEARRADASVSSGLDREQDELYPALRALLCAGGSTAEKQLMKM